MTWALQPTSWWPLLLLVPLALWVGAWLSRRYRASLRMDLGGREAVVCGARRFVKTRAALIVTAALSIAVALLRPVSPGKEAQLAPDIALCVDVSRSMAAGDGDPTRFEALRRQVHALLAQAVGSRVSLLAFAGEVQPVAPLTADREAIGWLLDELAVGVVGYGSGAVGGTDLGKAIDGAARSLARVGAVGEVLLLTDGEDFAGVAEQAARKAALAGHRVHCIGYGSKAGSKVVVEQDGEQGYLQDQAGEDVITRLDVASLERVAAAGDGSFVLGQGEDGLVEFWRDDLVPFSAQRRLVAGDADVIQRFGWPLFVGLLLLMLRLCLPERSR